MPSGAVGLSWGPGRCGGRRCAGLVAPGRTGRRRPGSAAVKLAPRVPGGCPEALRTSGSGSRVSGQCCVCRPPPATPSSGHHCAVCPSGTGDMDVPLRSRLAQACVPGVPGGEPHPVEKTRVPPPSRPQLKWLGWGSGVSAGTEVGVAGWRGGGARPSGSPHARSHALSGVLLTPLKELGAQEVPGASGCRMGRGGAPGDIPGCREVGCPPPRPHCPRFTRAPPALQGQGKASLPLPAGARRAFEAAPRAHSPGS